MPIIRGIALRRRRKETSPGVDTHTGIIDTSITTTVSATGKGTTYGSLVSNIDVSTIVKGGLFVLGSNSISIDTSTTIIGSKSKDGNVALTIECNTVLSGTRILVAACNTEIDASVALIGGGTYVHLGACSTSIDCSTVVAGGFDTLGIVNSTIEVSSSAFGWAILEHVAEFSGNVECSVNSIPYTIVPSKVNTFFGSRVVSNGIITYGAKVSSSIDIGSVLLVQLFKKGIVSVTIDTTVLATASYVHKSFITTNSTINSSLIGGLESPASLHSRGTVTTLAKESLTKGAKCAIIGETSVDIFSYNYKYVAFSLVADTGSSLSAAISREALTSVSSLSYSNIVGKLLKGATTTTSIHTYSSISGNLSGACILEKTNIVKNTDTTTISQLINSSTTICGE